MTAGEPLIRWDWVGNHLSDIGDRITELLTMKVPDGLIAKLSMLPKFLEVGKFPPRVRGGKPACQHIVLRDADVDLDTLPLMKCWPGDGGAYITMPMVIEVPSGSARPPNVMGAVSLRLLSWIGPS